MHHLRITTLLVSNSITFRHIYQAKQGAKSPSTFYIEPRNHTI